MESGLEPQFQEVVVSLGSRFRVSLEIWVQGLWSMVVRARILFVETQDLGVGVVNPKALNPKRMSCEKADLDHDVKPKIRTGFRL